MSKLYVESAMNQIGNSKNPHQGNTTKCLCVCSAGLLRSPTIARTLQQKYDKNVRACGTSQDYALIPLSSALLHWADEIHVVEEQAHVVRAALDELGLDKKVYELDIPDAFATFDYDLVKILEQHYRNIGYGDET